MIEDEEIEYTLNTLEEQPDEQIGTIEEQPEEQISTISEDIYTIGVESLNGQAGHLTLKNINGTDLVGAGDITLATPSDVQAEATAREEADTQLQNAINTKQDTLTAGANIQINGSVISATDTTYTAGDNIQINGTTISATDTTYSAGEGLNLNNTTFSVDTTTIATQGDVSNLQEQINGKQDQLSETQLNAVNSGIDSTKVEQIAANTSEIANKLDKTTTFWGQTAQNGAVQGTITLTESGQAATIAASGHNTTDAGIKMGNTKNYVEAGVSSVTLSSTNGDVLIHPKSGSVVNVYDSKITNVATPTADTDAANKKYVDDGLTTKQNTLTAGTNIDITSDIVSTQTRGVEYIVGTQASATNVWTGVSTDKGCSNGTLYVGKTIVYELPVAGNSSAATLTLTLPDGTTTSAIALRRAGSSTVTTTYGVGNVLFMVYNGTYWKVSAYYDSNTVSQLRAQNAYKAVTAITANTLCCGTSAGYIQLGAGSTFDITYPLLWQTAATEATATSTSFYYAIDGRTVRNNKSGWAGTAYKMVWLVGTLSDNTFTVDTDVFTQTVPTTDNGKVYAPIGIAYSAYQIYFKSPEQFWAFKNGEFRPLALSEAPQGFFTNAGVLESTGTNLTLNDQLALAPKSVQLDGNTEQISYTGKNLFDITNIVSISNTTYTSDGWATATLDNTNGSSTMYANFSPSTLPATLLPTDTTCTTVVEIQSVTGSGNIAPTSYQAASQFSNGTIIELTEASTGSIIFGTAKTKSDYTNCTRSTRTYVSVPAGGSITVTYRMSLFVGTSVTPEAFSYQPWTGGVPSPNPDYPQDINVVTGNQTVSINGSDYILELGSMELCKIGTYQDYIYKSGANWYKHAEVGKVVLSGEETWNTTINNNAYYVVQSDVLVNNDQYAMPMIVSDYYTPAAYRTLYDASVDYAAGIHPTQTRIMIRNKDCADSNALKTWLSTHNTTVYYALDTPTDTQITDATLISQLEALASAKMYRPQTNIISSGVAPNLDAIITIDTFQNNWNGLTEYIEGQQ